MSVEDADSDAHTHSRRAFLRAAGATGMAAMGATSGCLDLILGPGAGGGGAGTIPEGQIPSRQEIQPEDADVVVESVSGLKEQASQQDGRIIWIPADVTLDFTGDDLYLENVTVASGRGEGTAGARIITEDEGHHSPVWSGGSNNMGLILLEDNARLTGVEVRGPHYDLRDHPVLSSYIPFAPQSSRSARDAWRAERYARGVSIYGDNATVDNVEIHAFATQAITVGNDGKTPENVVIAHSHLHGSAMASLGYGVDVRHGHPQIHNVYFNACRHCVNGSGMADAGYYVTECIFGEAITGHQIDMHGVHDNIDGSDSPEDRDYRWRAGGTMVVRDSDIMTTRVPDLPFINRRAGSEVPHVHIRAVPEDIFEFTGNRCAHDNPDDAIEQSNIRGVYSPDSRGYRNLHYSDNVWGVDFESQEETS